MAELYPEGAALHGRYGMQGSVADSGENVFMSLIKRVWKNYEKS